jgi:GNAT superfamily N-acetyltransferase
MGETIVIRPVQKSDFEAWKPLWDGYNAFYGRHGETALPEEVTLRSWSRFFDPYEPMNAAIAEHAGRIVGLVHFILHRSTISIAPTCYLQDLFTLEDVRGKGVGRALIEHVYEFARRAACARVYWLTHESNATARALYDKVADNSGFIVYRKMI